MIKNSPKVLESVFTHAPSSS
ncbi:MAG: hypothetical protein K0S12_1980, partial [Bacteroidetes bacterium]|nr:hypothetical protein [Bacteroidota bacterium]